MKYETPCDLTILPYFTCSACGIAQYPSIQGSYTPDMGWTPQWYIFIMSGDFWVPLGRRNPKYFDEKDEDGRYWKTEGVSRRVEVAQDLHVDEVYEPTDIMIGMLHAGAYSEITVTVTPPNYYQPGSHGTENPINSTVHYNWDYLGTFDRTTPPFYGKRGIRKTI